MVRGRGKQTKHDTRVKREADKLKRKGWKVKADIPGYHQPKPIGKEKRVPDVVARKKGATRIIEVETKDTLVKDKAQQSTFKRSAAQKKRTTYETVVANKKPKPKNKRRKKK